MTSTYLFMAVVVLPLADPGTASHPTPVASDRGQLPVSMPAPASGKKILNPSELHRGYGLRVAHAPDYRWLAGQLFYAHTDGGFWVLRYAPYSVEDRHGGCVAFARDVVLDGYREGDFVIVAGEILSQRGTASLACPLYRVQSLQLVERPER